MHQEYQSLLDTLVEKEPMIIVGKKGHVNNIFNEWDHEKSLIKKTFTEYFKNVIFNTIEHRTAPMITYCVCSDYTTDNGKYGFSILVGEQVTKIEHLALGLSNTVLPKQKYLTFKAGPGPISEIAAAAWKRINTVDYAKIGLTRTYRDYELFSQQQEDLQNVSYEIYVGVQSLPKLENPQQLLDTLVEKDSIIVVGRSESIEDVRNEWNSEKAKIGEVFKQYFQNQTFQQIEHRVTPMLTYGVCHNYTANSGFTLLVGEQVSKIEKLKDGLSNYTLPKQHYLIFKAGPGPVQEVAHKTWCKIGTINYAELGLKRTQRDFEIYGEGAKDPNHTEYEIFVGVEKI